MEPTQILIALSFTVLGIFCITIGMLMMVNVKVRDWFANWWYFMDDTESGKRFDKKYVKFINGPMVIFAGLVSLYVALTFLNLLPTGW